MSDEAQIRASLQINSGNLSYQSQPTAFNADVAGSKGPVPGAFAATVEGTDIDLSELTTPGLCRVQNLDDTNFVTVGVWDVSATEFYPLLELLPGETFVFRLSRHVGAEVEAPGTGTYAGATNLRVRADTAACNVLVEAFEV